METKAYFRRMQVLCKKLKFDGFFYAEAAELPGGLGSFGIRMS